MVTSKKGRKDKRQKTKERRRRRRKEKRKKKRITNLQWRLKKLKRFPKENPKREKEGIRDPF